MPSKKDAIFIPSGKTPHLFFVLTDPCKDGKQLIVNISRVVSTIEADPACILHVGDHPFIREDSAVMYGLACAVTEQSLVDGLASKEFKAAAPISDEVHKKLCEGLLASRHTPAHIKTYFRQITGKLEVAVVKRRIIHMPKGSK